MKKIIPFLFLIFLNIFCNNLNKTNENIQILQKNIDYVNSIFVKVKYNNIFGSFLLDSGSPCTVLDSQFVANNNIELDSIGTTKLSGTGNNTFNKVICYKNIGLELFNQENISYLLVYNLKNILPIEDGIIGIEFFATNLVNIDYQNQRIEILNNQDEIDESFTKIPIIVIDNQMYINLSLKINDDINLNGLFLIDTGSEYAITINNYNTDSLDLFNKIDKKLIRTTPNGGIGDTTYKFLIKGQVCKINKFEINNILVSCSLQSKNATNDFKNLSVGSVGNLLLEKFNVIFDMKNSCIYLKFNFLNSNNFTYIRSGINLGNLLEAGFLVKYITKETTAENNEIKTGDIITEINGESVASLGYFKTRQKLQQKGNVEVKILRNNEILIKNLNVDDLLKNL